MRFYWIVTVLLGVGIIVLSGPVLSAFPEAGHDVSAGYGAPIFAFEMAVNSADLIAIFGPDGDPFRANRIAQMNKGNVLDYPFMAVYSLYMASFFYAIWRTQGYRLWLVFLGFGLLAGIADAVENLILLNLTSDLNNAPFIAWLPIPVWTKFASIMICVFGGGTYLVFNTNWAWKFIGAIALIGGASIPIAFFNPAQLGFLIAPGTTAGWLAMLVFAMVRSFHAGRAEVS